MKNFKEQKGITLVALVVTIIVLLILAGVTILYVMSDDGVFGSAQEANKNTNTAFVKEVLLQAILEAQADYYTPATEENPKTVTNAATALTFIKGQMTAAGITATNLTCTSFCNLDESGDETTDGTVLGGTVEYQDVTYGISINTKAGTSTVTAQE